MLWVTPTVTPVSKVKLPNGKLIVDMEAVVLGSNDVVLAVVGVIEVVWLVLVVLVYVVEVAVSDMVAVVVLVSWFGVALDVVSAAGIGITLEEMYTI